MESKNVFVTSASTLDGFKIVKYGGFISVEKAINFQLGLFSTGNDKIENTITDVKNLAIKDLKEKIADLDCNAIIGLDLDFNIFTFGGIYKACVSANGNAVVIEKE